MISTPRFAICILLLLLVQALGLPEAAAQEPPPEAELTEQKVVADDPSENARFGSAVAIDNVFAVIGSSDDNTDGADAGSAYLFEVVDSVWVQRQKFLPGDASAGARFGASVSLSKTVTGTATGVVVAVGSPGLENEQGSVFIFRESSGVLSQEQKVEADDGAAGDGFGESLSLHGDVLVVGSAGHSASGIHSGAVYVYRFNGNSWSLETKLRAPVITAGDLFGASVGVYDNLIAVGASRDDSSGTDAGMVYVFRHDGATWLLEQRLIAEDGFDFDLLGSSVDVADSLIIAGAYGNDLRGQKNAGSAYIWRNDGLQWIQEIRLEADDAAKDDHFGISVALTDSLAVVGSHWDNQKGDFSGSAYVFQNETTGWNQIYKLTASDGDDLDLFGEAVAVSGYTAFIGTPRHDDTATDSGSAYFYAIPRPDLPPGPVAIEIFEAGIPSAFRISSVYPNPFRDRLTVEFELVRSMPVVLTMYNIAGQEVARLDAGYVATGKNDISWNAQGLAAGIYLIRMQSAGESVTAKVVHLR